MSGQIHAINPITPDPVSLSAASLPTLADVSYQAPGADGLTDAWRVELELYVAVSETEGHSANTIRTRRSSVRVMARSMIQRGAAEPAKVTRQLLVPYLAGEVKRRQGAGAANHYADLESFWGWYCSEYPGSPNPMAGMKRPRSPMTRTRLLADEQLAAVLGCLKGADYLSVRNLLIVTILLDTGMRLGELVALDITDIDLKAKLITIRHGKGDKFRISLLSKPIEVALLRYLRLRNRKFPDMVGQGALLLSTTGRRMTDSRVSVSLSHLGDRAGVPGLRAHLFRHIWAHKALKRMNERDVLTLGGWSSSKMLQRYAITGAQERALEAARGFSVTGAVGGR